MKEHVTRCYSVAHWFCCFLIVFGQQWSSVAKRNKLSSFGYTEYTCYWDQFIVGSVLFMGFINNKKKYRILPAFISQQKWYGPPNSNACKLTASMSKHRCSLSMSNSPGVIGGSGDWQEGGVVLALELEWQRKGENTSEKTASHQWKFICKSFKRYVAFSRSFSHYAVQWVALTDIYSPTLDQ